VVVLVAAAASALALTGPSHDGKSGARLPSTCSVYLANGTAIVVLTTPYAELACPVYADEWTTPVKLVPSVRSFGGSWRWKKGDRARDLDPAPRRICTGTSSTGATMRVYDSGRSNVGRDVCRFIAAAKDWKIG
jgi:hypothetical protein